MPQYQSVLPITNLQQTNDKARSFHSRVKHATRGWQLAARDRIRLDAVFGDYPCSDRIFLSDAIARARSTQILFDCIGQHFASRQSAKLQFFHFTFVDDIGLTSDREPVLHLQAMRRKVDKAVRELGLSCLAFIEVQALTNYPANGQGRTLMLHCHAICWGAVSRRTLRNAKRRINTSRSWSNRFDAKPIKSRRLKNGVDDALRIGNYISKMPYDAKYRVPAPGRSGGYRFKPTVSGYPKDLALRIAEGLSFYSIFDAVFGVNEGKHLRKVWKSELVSWHKKRLISEPAVNEFNVKALWRRARARNGSRLYRPFTIR